jgi:heme/copper-type cytochrome/quinol oxidase subunit 2
VWHTFTIPALGINVPIAAHARVIFTIHTGAAGTFTWRCFDPCGAGSNGWGTAMAAMRGFMEGTLTVA